MPLARITLTSEKTPRIAIEVTYVNFCIVPGHGIEQVAMAA